MEARLKNGTLVVLGALLALGACTASPTGSNLATAPDGGEADAALDGSSSSSFQAPPGQLALRVDQARQRRVNGTAGQLLIVATLANGDGAPAVAMNAAYFKLKVASGLLKAPVASVVAREALWVDGRVPALSDSLAGGASYAGWLLGFDVDTQADGAIELSFEVPGVATGAALVGDGRKAAAPVTVEACATCGAICTYLDRDNSNCGVCDNATSTLACKKGELVCPKATETLCKTGNYCVDLQAIDSANCGSCGKTCSQTSFTDPVCVAGSCSGEYVEYDGNDHAPAATCAAYCALKQEVCVGGVVGRSSGGCPGDPRPLLCSDPLPASLACNGYTGGYAVYCSCK